LNDIFKQILSFIGVGGIMAFCALICYYFFLQIFNFPIYPVYIIVNIVTTYFSYVLNAKYTFRKKKRNIDLIKYYFTYLLGFFVGLCFIFLIKNNFLYSNFITILLSIPPRVVTTFLISRIFIFK